MTTPIWIVIVVNLFAVGVAWGVISSKVAQLREQVIALQVSREKQGKRIGDLHTAIEIIKSHQLRRPTLLPPAAETDPEEET